MITSPSPDSRKRKLSTDDLCEDGEIVSDDEIQTKISKIDNGSATDLPNLNSDKTIQSSDKSRIVEEIDKNETIDGFVVIEDADDKTIVVENSQNFDDKDKNCCSQCTVTTDSGIGSQSLDLDGNLTQTSEIVPNNDILIESPCITIQFKDKTICEQYKVKFLKFINNFVELKTNTDDLNIEIYRDTNFDPTEWEVVDETFNESLIDDDYYSSSPKKHRKKSKIKKELFIVDANPTPHKNGNDLRYTSKFVISTDKTVEENKSTLKCFNCGEDHLLKDCSQSRDLRRIKAARDKLKQPQKPTRYHVEPDQKLNQLAPGKLSNELRNALGLRRHELPPFIYRMRTFGYPPGWLEEAKIVYSDLNLFDIDGKNLKNHERKSGGIDPTKIIDYPGFNCPLPDKYRDEYKFYGVPQYSERFSKETMIKYVEEQSKRIVDNFETVDMDLDDNDVTMVTIPDESALSLNELEQQKQELLNELKEQIVSDEKIESTTEQRTTTVVEETTRVVEETNEQTVTEETNETQEKSINPVVKSTCYGTPVLKTNSPYDKLPNPDNFSKDVSPVIHFENLPNSTGKYEQMVDVLQKVRKTLRTQQSCTT